MSSSSSYFCAATEKLQLVGEISRRRSVSVQLLAPKAPYTPCASAEPAWITYVCRNQPRCRLLPWRSAASPSITSPWSSLTGAAPALSFDHLDSLSFRGAHWPSLFTSTVQDAPEHDHLPWFRLPRPSSPSPVLSAAFPPRPSIRSESR